jgi:hypothetical protein
MSKSKHRQHDSLFDEDNFDTDVDSYEESSGREAHSPPSASLPLDNTGMDKRCPMRLKEYPTSFCPMAVIRLKAIKGLEKFPTEEEEAKLPGCSYSINHQQSCYCWFKYARDYLTKEVPYHEIAHLLNIPEDEVIALEQSALEKVKGSSEVVEIKKNHHEGGVFEGSGEYPHHEIHLARKK